MPALTQDNFTANPYLIPTVNGLVTETPNNGKYRLITGTASHNAGANSHLPNIKKIDLAGGAGTIWLPYYQSSITCVQLPMDGSATVFLTDNLSGCAIYIGRDTANNRWYACHANSQLGSSKAEMTGKKPNHQAEPALRELDKLARDAATRLGMALVGGVVKSRYMLGVSKVAPTVEDFIGGTTVAAFWKVDHWVFWFQTWGSVSGAASAVIESAKFFSTKDPKKYPLQK